MKLDYIVTNQTKAKLGPLSLFYCRQNNKLYLPPGVPGPTKHGLHWRHTTSTPHHIAPFRSAPLISSPLHSSPLRSAPLLPTPLCFALLLSYTLLSAPLLSSPTPLHSTTCCYPQCLQQNNESKLLHELIYHLN